MFIGDIHKSDEKVERYLGGIYSLISSIIKGGTGSVRIAYVKGLKELDDIGKLNPDLNVCNMQIFKNGFAIRLMKKSKGTIAAVQFS